MSSFNLEEVTKALENASVSSAEELGISFEGQNLKLDTANDAKPIVEAIIACKQLGYLNLAGNTLGVDAAAALAKALEKHPEFKRALWKDLFTGRLKEEIPKALEHLGNGLVLAGARLTELDLSDNAFGPIGVRGLASLLRSNTCFELRALRLNNNGLGITGGRLLASALTDCYKCSSEQGTPLQLKVFIAGRNRLENEGAKALANVFEQIGTLEEIAMPQNGIYHDGITALADAFSKNKNLQILNLNDNTLGPKGSCSLAKALVNLQQLRCLNLGDCLIKSRGAEYIAESIAPSHPLLEEINLESNEIKGTAGLTIACAVANKPNLTQLLLDANQFKSIVIEEIRQVLNDAGVGDALGEFEENESDASDDEEEEEDETGVEDISDEEEEEEENAEIDDSIKNNIKNAIEIIVNDSKSDGDKVSVMEFLETPTAEKFLALGDRTATLLAEAKSHPDDTFLIKYIPVLMKVSALVDNSSSEASKAALETSDELYKELFAWAIRTQQLVVLNNVLMIHLGLMKAENKFKPSWNIDGCMLALENALKQKYFPTSTKETLKAFLGGGRQVLVPTKRIDSF